MPNRIAVTAAVSLALAIGSGTVALATTLTGPTGIVGTDAAVSLDRPAPTTTTTPTGSVPAFDPQAVALLAFADGMARNAAATPGAPVTASGGVGSTAAGSTSNAPAAVPGGHGDGGGDDTPIAVPGSDPVAAPPTTTTTSPPPFDCRGSDDGLSEAVKHAREAYCHGGDD